MKLIRIFLLLIFVVSYSSCRKKPYSYSPDMLGVWTATYGDNTLEVNILEDGKSTYYEDWDSAYVETDGVAKIIVKKDANDILVIGKKELTITEDNNIDADVKYPTEVIGTDPHWEVIFDNITFRKEL